MQTFEVQQGSYGWNMDFTCTDSSGTAFNLTGYTATLKVWKEGRTTMYLSGGCTTDVAASGTCHYSVLTTNFDEIYKFYARIEATKASTVVKFEKFWIDVVE